MDDRSREIILREIEREKKEKQAGRRKQIRKQRSALFLIITVFSSLLGVRGLSSKTFPLFYLLPHIYFLPFLVLHSFSQFSFLSQM